LYRYKWRDKRQMLWHRTNANHRLRVIGVGPAVLVIYGRSWRNLCLFRTGPPSTWAPGFCALILSKSTILVTRTWVLGWFWEALTVLGPCIQGSPSICMGNVFLVVMMTSLHWAKRRPDARRPVRTWPMCRQFSRPITSMRRSPKSEIEIKIIITNNILFEPPSEIFDFFFQYIRLSYTKQMQKKE
jgi:hypothetical protein